MDKSRDLGPARSRRTVRLLIGGAITLAIAVPLLLYSGEEIEAAREFFRDPTPHEEYMLSLAHAGLSASALGMDWMDAAESAINGPLPISAPYEQEGFFAQEEALALGYRIHVERGQRLEVSLEMQSIEHARVFMDLFRAATDSTRRAAPVLYATEPDWTIEYEPRRTGDYILRVQPELLRGGRFRLRIRVGGALAFPVFDRNTNAVLSYFGDERDGGSRNHHGVDIFAPRGTPVVAAANGRVRRVQNTGIGGLVVWLTDEARNQSLYYAHLDRQLVENGDIVRVGDTLGLVGNTGNARTTPPHLHFGIYARRYRDERGRRRGGPIDPLPFLRQPTRELVAFSGDVDRIGTWVRVKTDGIRLRRSPGPRSEVVDELSTFTPVQVMAGAGDWYRVRLPDGRGGFLASRLTEPAETPLRTEAVDPSRPVHTVPAAMAPVQAVLDSGTAVDVLGEFDGFLYVDVPEGRRGWIQGESAGG